jgi:transcriptional regulator with XRE-family HTH domain
MHGDDSARAIGRRLRERRVELGLSQRALAVPGVYAYISRLEAGTRRPSVRALRQLAPKLGVSAQWLETGVRDDAEDLARLVIEHDGAPPPAMAARLARRVLRER